MMAQLWLVTVLVSAAWRADVTVSPGDPGGCWADCHAR
jgi:hypothetical protein